MTFKEWMLLEGGKGSGGFSFTRLVRGAFKPSKPHSPKRPNIKRFINPFK